MENKDLQNDSEREVMNKFAEHIGAAVFFIMVMLISLLVYALCTDRFSIHQNKGLIANNDSITCYGN